MFVLPLYGCRHCGEEERNHCQMWTEGVGWHGYTMPGEELVRSRIEIVKHAKFAATQPDKESNNR